jgi:hypothetical protein
MSKIVATFNGKIIIDIVYLQLQ